MEDLKTVKLVRGLLNMQIVSFFSYTFILKSNKEDR